MFQVHMATRVSLAVKTLFKKYPMASNAVVYGTLITGAEFTQQTITKKIMVSYKLLQFHNPSFMNTYTLHYIILSWLTDVKVMTDHLLLTRISYICTCSHLHRRSSRNLNEYAISDLFQHIISTNTDSHCI